MLPVATRALAQACRQLGLDARRILAQAGLTEAGLADADRRISAQAADAVWEAAFAASGNAALALNAAEQTPYGAFRVLDYLAASSSTLGEGLQRVAAYFPFIDPRGALEVTEGRAAATMTFRVATGPPPPPAQEYTFAILARRVRQLCAPAPAGLAVRFTFPRQTSAREAARVLGVEPEYGAKAAALVVARSTWDHPCSDADAHLFAALDGHARAQMARTMGSGFSMNVRAAIGAALPGTEPTLAAVARQLGTSARTIQRKLEAEGSSFGAEVDCVRRERAERFLRQKDVSIAEVSWLVGFAEQSAFARAFRRWTGMRPSAWRTGPGAARADARLQGSAATRSV